MIDWVQNKFRLKALLAGYERNAIQIVAAGAINNRARRLILADLKGLLDKYSRLCRLDRDEQRTLWNNSYKMLAKVWGRKSSQDIYTVLKKRVIYSNEFVRIKNLVANVREINGKNEYLTSMIDNSETPFFLSDTHKNCARGHKDYENRIYYDAAFKTRYGFDSETVAQIEKYILDNDLMTVQEVIGEGIWFVTRPNCTHRLVPVDLEAVLHGYKIGEIRSAAERDKKRSYEYTEKEYYYERYRILDDLMEVIPCSELQKDRRDTARLVRKWRKTEND